MSTSDVRNIDSLQRLRTGVLAMADSWEKTLQEIRIAIHRADQYFGDEVPRYWRHQTELAERELTEAKDNLQQKEAAARAGDRVSAMEARKRVAAAKTRLDLCRDRQRTAKSLAIEIRHQCDELLGPLADMTEHSDNRLPAAAIKLGTLLEWLHRYADAAQMPASPDEGLSASRSEMPSDPPPID
ncbi:hypothetical protein Mal15_34310 [Stieleria maiorica]|uniref:Chromosome partition protein Smc n=1 Tax=Stieleria maiorica TaxID=2795974 RepID=A0A5B9MK96_9BACT|nr:hypothetical protein [Stieleria maiorica]QEF99367.1 hypothetical protein Mal15_34310 [Stieleria maiorica]